MGNSNSRCRVCGGRVLLTCGLMNPRRPRQVRPPLPLAGETVVVTKPAASSAPLKRRIVALGGRALSLPGSSVRGVADVAKARASLRAARTVDFVIFVSPSAVRHAFAIAPNLRFARTARVCAIGAATARALRRRGQREVLWPRARQDSEGLLALSAFAALRGRRVVIVDAPHGRDLLPRELRARGAKVSHAHVYRRAPARLDRRHFDALAAAKAPLFMQLSSVDALANLRARLPDPLFARLTVGGAVVSSERIAHAVYAAGWSCVQVAASAGSSDMLAATLTALTAQRG